jgi:uncharacterized protein YbaP (TraB family)
VRILLIVLLLLASPLRAFECGGSDLLAQMEEEQRSALQARAATYPFHTGLFWRATRGDTTLTIFGTYHFFHTRTDRHIAAVLPYAQAADVTFFEMNHDDITRFEKQSQSDASLMFITQGPTLPEIMDEADWQRLRTRMSALGIPSFMTAKFKPVFVSMIIGFSPCRMRAQTLGSKGIDQQLARQLHEDGYDTRSIEDPATIVKLLDAFTLEEQIAMIKLSLDLPQDPDDLQETLLQLYFRGEIALLWEFGKLLSLDYGGPTAQADFDRFERALLTDRNRAWVEVLDADAPGKNIFVAVGAGHLPGESGVLNLLAQRGFAIEPLNLE